MPLRSTWSIAQPSPRWLLQNCDIFKFGWSSAGSSRLPINQLQFEGLYHEYSNFSGRYLAIIVVGLFNPFAIWKSIIDHGDYLKAIACYCKMQFTGSKQSVAEFLLFKVNNMDLYSVTKTFICNWHWAKMGKLYKYLLIIYYHNG